MKLPTSTRTTKATTAAAKKPAAKAPAKPATTRRKPSAQKPEADETDLLAGLGEPDEEEVDESELDLLSGITDENGTAWMPWEDDDHPEGIQGRVIYRGMVGSDYGNKDDVPYLELQDAKDPELVWTVRGYATALNNQITRTNPQVGDTWAVKYLGEVDSKNGTYHNFKAAVRHNS